MPAKGGAERRDGARTRTPAGGQAGQREDTRTRTRAGGGAAAARALTCLDAGLQREREGDGGEAAPRAPEEPGTETTSPKMSQRCPGRQTRTRAPARPHPCGHQAARHPLRRQRRGRKTTSSRPATDPAASTERVPRRAAQQRRGHPGAAAGRPPPAGRWRRERTGDAQPASQSLGLRSGHQVLGPNGEPPHSWGILRIQRPPQGECDVCGGGRAGAPNAVHGGCTVLTLP